MAKLQPNVLLFILFIPHVQWIMYKGLIASSNDWHIHTYRCEHDWKCKHKDTYKYRKTKIISSPPVVFVYNTNTIQIQYKHRTTKIISSPPVVFVSSSIRFLIAFWDSFSFSSSSLRSAGNILINILLKIFCKCIMSTLLLMYLEMAWFWIICHALQQLVETVGYWRRGEYNHLHFLKYVAQLLFCVLQ